MALRNTKPFKDTVEGLTGRAVEFTYGKPIDPDAKHMTGVYVNPDGLMVALVEFDLPAVAYLGAAIGMLPKGKAEDCIETRALDEDLVENTGEVLNVIAAALGDECGIHHRLDCVYKPGEALPQHVAVLAGSPARLDFTLTVTGYGEGTMSIAVFPDQD